MFDPFGGGVSAEQLKHVHLEGCISTTAIMMLLVEKGIATEEEFCKMRLRAQPIVEQEMQRKQDELQKQFEEDNPELAKWGKLLRGQQE